MRAAGIDLGGTKIEAQIFDDHWTVIATERVQTPKTYQALIAAIVDLVRACGDLPVGISAAGLIHPQTGIALTANLPASGHPFPADVAAVAHRPVTWVNDARALILSEAIFGVAEAQSRVAGLILGTGVGGGVAVDGRLVLGPTGTAGEFGHSALPASLVVKYGLPVVACPCGRVGCVETLLSGPGMVRLAQALGEPGTTPKEIAAAKGQTWRVWCEMLAELLMSVILIADPQVVVIAGGLSNIPHLVPDVSAALARAQFAGYPLPDIRIARGGDTAGALGAAYAAWRQAQT